MIMTELTKKDVENHQDDCVVVLAEQCQDNQQIDGDELTEMIKRFIKTFGDNDNAS